MSGTTDERCWLCSRVLGKRIEYHHPVPKCRGGRETVPIHPICHRILHRTLSNKELESRTLDDLRSHPDIARFLDWITNKDPNFHAPTHRKR